MSIAYFTASILTLDYFYYRNTGSQVTYRFQDLFYCLCRQIESHAHHHFYQCHFYPEELFFVFQFLYLE